MGKFDFGAFGQSAANAGVNSLFGLLGARLQQKYNRENMALQNDYQKGFLDYENNIWQQQNATQVQNQQDLTRENPILQKIGMQQAGLNVNGQAGGNVAAAPSGASVGSGSVGLPSSSNPFAGFTLDLFGKMNELKIQQSQQHLLDSQAANVAADTEGKQIDNLYKENINKKHIELTDEQIALNRQHRLTSISEMNLNDEKRHQVEKETEWMDTLNEEQVRVLQSTADKYMADAALALEKIDTEKSIQSLNASLSAKARAEANEANERAKTEVVTRAIRQAELQLVKEGISPSDASAFATTCRRAIFHPEYYGGVEESCKYVNNLIYKQYNLEYDKERLHGGPLGILDVIRAFNGANTENSITPKGNYDTKSAPSYISPEAAKAGFHR